MCRAGTSWNGSSAAKGSFCPDGSRLQIPVAFALEDEKRKSCRHRRDSLDQARSVGVDIGRCVDVASRAVNGKEEPYYSLQDLRSYFGESKDQVKDADMPASAVKPASTNTSAARI